MRSQSERRFFIAVALLVLGLAATGTTCVLAFTGRGDETKRVMPAIVVADLIICSLSIAIGNSRR
jgi:hypothetical protein